MQTMTLPSTLQAITTIKWLSPAPFWKATNQEITRPYLAEFTSDNFLPDFLATMASGSSSSLTILQDTKNTATPIKLYQPLHQRYYLVLGSLVCRLWGMPDHTVMRKNSESTAFVVRKIRNGQEYAWVNNSSQTYWQRLQDEHGNRIPVLPNEQRLPLHPVQTRLQANDELRTLYYGYIPVGSCVQYLDPVPVTETSTLVQQAVNAGTLGDPRFDELNARVIESWRKLYTTDTHGIFINQLQPELVPTSVDTVAESAAKAALLRQVTLYLLLDLADCLQKFLPEVFHALGTDGSSLNGMPKRAALLTALSQTAICDGPNDTPILLSQALYNLRDALAAAKGLSDLPSEDYYLYSQILLPPLTDNQMIISHLYDLFCQAIQEANRPITIPDEIQGLFKQNTTASGGNTYCLRLLYERGPCYAPIISEPSAMFTFAKPLDPDAPARPIRIEMPSVKPRDLRQFKRGVGIQMTPELNQVINGVNTRMLTGGGLVTGAGVAMICTFSLPIITLVAFIVMFLFLLLFNIIFWWLPFIRICFPLPTLNPPE